VFSREADMRQLLHRGELTPTLDRPRCLEHVVEGCEIEEEFAVKFSLNHPLLAREG
jgi:hypothetical protein